MSIIVATDLTPESHEAARIGAQLARAVGVPLVLVHVLEPDSWFPLEGELQGRDFTEERAAAARKMLAGIELEISNDALKLRSELVEGSVEDALAAAAHRNHASLAVVGGAGKRGKASPNGVAEALAAQLPCPVLIARPSTQGFSAAFANKHRLRVFMPIDRSVASDAPIAWVKWLRSRVPCDVLVDYFYWPPTEHHRLGIPVNEQSFEAHPKVVKALEDEMRARLGELGGVGSLTVRAQPGIGSVGVFAEQSARAYEADLIVVGSHRRHGLNRYIHGSVSLDMIRYSDVPVVCVAQDVMPSAEPAPIRRVLVATDLSDTAKLCVHYAIALLGSRGGSVKVVYVDSLPLDGSGSGKTGNANRLTPVKIDELQRKLHGMLPEELNQSNITFDTTVLEGGPAADAILQAAARANADVICMSTRGAGALERALTGSVATEVVQRATCPVFVVKTREA